MPKKDRVSVVGGLHNGKSFVTVNGVDYFQKIGYSTDLRSKDKATLTIPMRPFGAKQFDELVDRVATKLVSRTDVKEILVQTLRQMPLDSIETIDAELKKPKPRVRKEKGCVVLRVAGIPLMLRQ